MTGFHTLLKRTINITLYFVFLSFNRKLGNDWIVEDGVLNDIEAFTCAMYGYPREKDINVVRSKMLKKMVGEDKPLSYDSKVDLSHLPPNRYSLVPHVQRVNHRLVCYKTADIQIFEKPKWTRSESGLIEPLWTRGKILPQSVVDLLDNIQNEEDEEDGDMEVDEF